MVAIYAVHCNFARTHKALRITPSMAAGLSDHGWSLEEIVMMAGSNVPAPKPRDLTGNEGQREKPVFVFLAATFLCLGLLTLYRSVQAFHRGNRELFVVLAIVAAIFFSRLPGKRS
jgi:hypothetical protein